MYINGKCHLSHIFGKMSTCPNASSSKFCMCMLLVTGESGEHVVLHLAIGRVFLEFGSAIARPIRSSLHNFIHTEGWFPG